MRLLDLFCGRWGWSKAFATRGWECVGVDLVEPPEVPKNCQFLKQNILEINPGIWLKTFDFICASSPCEQFSVHGMKHFHPNPPYPELGIRLFNHTRMLCESASVPYVMENVRSAQRFVGDAVHHCGPFYLWGTGVPPLMHKGIRKGYSFHIKGMESMSLQQKRDARKKRQCNFISTAEVAEIPPELANCVADYAERLIEMVT